MKMVRVDKYNRKDGTRVVEHNRSSPEFDSLKFSKKDLPVGGYKKTEKKTEQTMAGLAKKKNSVDEFNKSVLSEREVKLLMRRINDGKINVSELFSRIPALYDGEGISLTQDLVSKGKAWLMNQWKSPDGAERKNNPFRAREIAILEDFDTIKFKDVYSERGNYYYPLWIVYGDNTSMEYYVSGGQISIVG